MSTPGIAEVSCPLNVGPQTSMAFADFGQLVLGVDVVGEHDVQLSGWCWLENRTRCNQREPVRGTLDT